MWFYILNDVHLSIHARYGVKSTISRPGLDVVAQEQSRDLVRNGENAEENLQNLEEIIAQIQSRMSHVRETAVEISIEREQRSSNLRIQVDGFILKILADLLYITENDKLDIRFSSVIDVRRFSTGERIGHSDEIQDLELNENTHNDDNMESLHMGRVAPVPLSIQSFIDTENFRNWKWQFIFSIKIDVTGFINFSAVLPPPEVFAQRLWNEKEFPDVKVKDEDGNFTFAHRDVLKLHSDVFRSCFKWEHETRVRVDGLMEQPNRTLDLSDIPSQGVVALFEFLYCSQVQKPMADVGVAIELFRAGHKYWISTLFNAMKIILLRKDIDWYDAYAAYELHKFSVLIGDIALSLKTRDMLKIQLPCVTDQNLIGRIKEEQVVADLLPIPTQVSKRWRCFIL